ncbi:MAG: tRNA lysidine(34) synthetase TilS [Bacteroides sp.]|nr:tRNA lysidine(34) synthetase TilS [Roseburia sp.]MCM1345498.1 tRNA lysidine(34) synthetase TilS [Bacteroides sp.]MCM1420007.1 tRNA lysidine(34) synthetase TilS [Bacteroides sp.]
MGNLTNIEDSVSRFIEDNSLLDIQAGKVLVALSGGADSVCLLLLLRNLGYECEAIHCNFYLRGKESRRDEDFVKMLCEQLRVKLYVKGFNTVQYAADRGISIEMAARELRYSYFSEVLEESGAQAVAVGHHRDDNVETLLLNIVRGSGIHGMCGIPSRNGKIVRPLLCVSRNDIVDYLERKGQEYVVDSTNKLDVFSRNKIRLDVMPVLSTINLSASANIAFAIEHLNEACKVYDKAIREDISKCLRTVGNTRLIDVKRVEECVSPRSVMHEILSPLGFTRSQEEDIAKAMNGTPGRLFSAKKWRLLIDRGQIVIAPIQTEEVEIERKFRFASHEGTMLIDGCGTINYKIIDRENLVINPDKRFAYLDVDKMHGPLTIRTVHQGDSFSPFGLHGTKLLSDFMTDIKLTRFEKETQKVICDGNEIAWVVGERSSEIFRVDSNTKKVLVLELIRK